MLQQIFASMFPSLGIKLTGPNTTTATAISSPSTVSTRNISTAASATPSLLRTLSESPLEPVTSALSETINPHPIPRNDLPLEEPKRVPVLAEKDVFGRHLPGARTTCALPLCQTDRLSSAVTFGASELGSTITSSDPPPSCDDASPYAIRNGRLYLSDPSLAYPLPVDLIELHRQSLRTLLLIQVFGSPVCSNSVMDRPLGHVLEVGCGSGFWSQMCHRHFVQRGHPDIQFVGIDIGPMGMNAGDADCNMNWLFVQHDLCSFHWPFANGEFDLVMVKDLSLVVSSPNLFQATIEECCRILRPGGTLEIWDSDHQIRMLREHAPDVSEENVTIATLGAYSLSFKTPLTTPLNDFLDNYNTWIHRALATLNLSPVPCTIVGSMLFQESKYLMDVQSRRLAIPLSAMNWEFETAGGVVTKDGKSFISSGKDNTKPKEQMKTLTATQAALRRTAMMTVVDQIQSLESILRETNGMTQYEWDSWLDKMRDSLMNENGASWGECLEVGAWWATKK
ncbi:sam binding domain-containing protein containing protein [Colletotrichum tabaci]|uniref:Sam binding domain-containing protein containing protein n=1 Tax=Colletotrichum tabaci TaxID=1209068 RepID=A0AAV9SSL3_9PEZI